jgi:hypothetical protein
MMIMSAWKRFGFALSCGFSILAMPAWADDYVIDVPQSDVPIEPGAYADVPVTIANTTASTSPELVLQLQSPYGDISYLYELRSGADCGPLTPEFMTPTTLRSRIGPIPAGGSTTCVIRVSRGTGEINSALVFWAVFPSVGDGYSSVGMRFGTFADIELGATELSRTVSSEGIHTVIRLTAHNNNERALTATIASDGCRSGQIQHVVAGACVRAGTGCPPVSGPIAFLGWPSIAPGATEQCDIESTLDLSEDMAASDILISEVSDSATGGHVHASIGEPERVPLPLHFAAVALNQYGVSGSWANAATPAQGVVLNVVPDFYGDGHALLFGGWFTYDRQPTGVQRWYTIQGNVAGTGDGYATEDASGIYWSAGGEFDSSRPATTSRLGNAWVRFADCNHGQIHYEFDHEFDRRGTIPITRLLPNANCTTDGAAAAVAPGADYNLTGTWADPSSSSQGLVIDVDPSQHVLFAGWFTFPSSFSNPYAQAWYTLQGLLEPNAPRGSGIAIYESNGGLFDAATPTTTVPVGDVDITMHTCSSATLAYRFTGGGNAGRSGTIELQRLGNAPAHCSM